MSELSGINLQFKTPGGLRDYTRHIHRNDILLTLITLILYLGGIAKYGYSLLLSLVVSVIVGFAIEYLTFKIRKKPFGDFAYPLWVLFPLILPPTFPLWMLAISLAFGTLIGISFFGGHGREIASPIAIGWTFAVLSFPTSFSFGWSYPFPGFQEGFTLFKAALPTVDHPITIFKSRATLSLLELLTGDFPQPPANAIPLLLIGCGVLILLLRAVDYRGFVSFAGTTLILSAVFRFLIPEKISPLSSLLVGNFILASIFVYPVTQTSARTHAGRWLSGILAGSSYFLIRNFSSYPDGVFFAVLFGNIFSPIIDEMFLHINSRGFTNRLNPQRNEGGNIPE